MRLKTWMLRNRLSPRKLAPHVGVSHQAIRFWLKGITRPTRRHLAVLRTITDGRVNAESFK